MKCWEDGDWFELIDQDGKEIDSGHSVNQWTIEKLLKHIGMEIHYQYYQEED